MLNTEECPEMNVGTGKFSKITEQLTRATHATKARTQSNQARKTRVYQV